MSQKDEFHNLDNAADGLFRELAAGVTTRIFSGEQAMLSVVTLAPHAQGTLHHHPEEQWGVLLDGSAIRVQGGEEIPVKKGDFWRTPGNVPHTMRAGPDGARVLDISVRRALSTRKRDPVSARPELRPGFGEAEGFRSRYGFDMYCGRQPAFISGFRGPVAQPDRAAVS